MKFLLVIATITSVLVTIAYGYPSADEKAPSDLITQDEDNHQQSSSNQPAEVSYRQREELQGDQTFYPSFAPFQRHPLGHSRPFFFQQEGAYSQRAVSPFQQQLSYDTYRGGGGGGGNGQNSATSTHDLLGSGNFGVIRGGTFYSDNDKESSNYQQKYSPFYRNGHGRPLFFKRLQNPRPQQHEQFANFRDFADINTPSYSEFVVVYANKNSTSNAENAGNAAERVVKRPKNIIEQLALLDLEVSSTTAVPPTKKLSKSKRKLALLLPEKKTKRNLLTKTTTVASVDLNEPLLALS